MFHSTYLVLQNDGMSGLIGINYAVITTVEMRRQGGQTDRQKDKQIDRKMQKKTTINQTSQGQINK